MRYLWVQEHLPRNSNLCFADNIIPLEQLSVAFYLNLFICKMEMGNFLENPEPYF